MNLTDASGRLGRWRLRLLEFDFTAKYRKGSENSVADAVSRLPTYGYQSLEPDLDIPCFTVEARQSIMRKICLCAPYESSELPIAIQAHKCTCCHQTPKLVVLSTFDVDLWCIFDWDLVEDEQATDANILLTAQSDLSLVTVEELLAAQINDTNCEEIRERMARGEDILPLLDDGRGLIMHLAPIDGTKQILVPPGDLRTRLLHLAHHTSTSGHPETTKELYTMRKTSYCPSMIEDIRKVSKVCHLCAQERVRLRSHQAPLKRFPASRPLESVAMDLLGPLPTSSKGYRFLLVMTDRFSKMTHALPLKSITALSVSHAFVNHWVLHYGPPAVVLSDNGSQFTSKLLQYLCKMLKVKNAFTTAYHPQTNGQAERFNRTLLTGLRAFVSDHPKSCYEHSGLITYAYDTQVHSSSGIAPFELVLSEPPQGSVLRKELSEETLKCPRSYKEQFREAIKRLAEVSAWNISRAQARYKRNFNKRVKPLNQAVTGNWVYITREQPVRDGSGIAGDTNCSQRRKDHIS